MTTAGPLTGLRVIDLTDDLGRFGTKLLASFGAEVCRAKAGGSRGRRMSGSAAEFGGVLDWWFDSAKVSVDLDLNSSDGRDDYRRLAAKADLIIESMPVGFLTEHGIDHGDLVSSNPGLTQVSLTPFGRTGPRALWQTSDLVAGALGGVLSVSGTAEEPINPWGWQNYNFGGFSAAISGLAGVRSARRSGTGQLIDLSLHEVMVGSIENLFMQFFYDDLLPLPKVAERQGSLHWLGAYEVVPAKTGHVMITPTPQAEQLIDWMIECGISEAEPFVGLSVEELLERMPELMKAMRAFTLTKDADELFVESQRRHIAFGEVQTIAQVAENPQFAHRGLYGDIELADGSSVTGPWRLVRFSETPIGPPTPPSSNSGGLDYLMEEWSTRPSNAQLASNARPVPTDGDGLNERPLEGLRVVDLSWVLAGPFSTRLLGDLGADVIKVQTEERATLVNRPDFPYYPVWNRSKRSATLDFKKPGAIEIVRKLIESADVLVENYSAGVLDRLGLGWESVREWNDQLVYISMSGCGHDGPWKDIISYAPTIHALCGLTHLTNPPDRGDVGCGFSLNDHAAGFGAALSVLAAIEARNQTGRGQYIDMAQLEVGAFLLGPAIVDFRSNGHEAVPAGNVDGMADVVPNQVYPCRDGRFLAVTASDDTHWQGLKEVVGWRTDPLPTVEDRRLHRSLIDQHLIEWCGRHDGNQAMQLLQSGGVPAGVVQDAEDLAVADEQLQARRFWLQADHDEFGSRPHDRYPGQWSRSNLEPYRKPPAYLGEANFEVWTELAGLDFETVAEGVAEGLFS